MEILKLGTKKQVEIQGKESYLEYFLGILARLVWVLVWIICLIIMIPFCFIWAIFEPIFKE